MPRESTGLGPKCQPIRAEPTRVAVCSEPFSKSRFSRSLDLARCEREKCGNFRAEQLEFLESHVELRFALRAGRVDHVEAGASAVQKGDLGKSGGLSRDFCGPRAHDQVAFGHANAAHSALDLYARFALAVG